MHKVTLLFMIRLRSRTFVPHGANERVGVGERSRGPGNEVVEELLPTRKYWVEYIKLQPTCKLAGRKYRIVKIKAVLV